MCWKLTSVINQQWFTVQQAATYRGMSRRSIDRAILLKKGGIANDEMEIKLVGNQWRIKRSSLDNIEQIITNGRHCCTLSSSLA